MPFQPRCVPVRSGPEPSGIWLAIVGILFGLAIQPVCASEQRRTTTVKIVEQAKASIVNIHGQKVLAPTDDGYKKGELQKVNGMGTGVVIDQRGYIITNHHVVDGVRAILVSSAGGKNYTAKLVAHDPKTDLAIIKISAPEKLPVIDIGTSSDLMVGEPVIAVGNAFGYENTVTSGIISSLHRTVQVSDAQNYHDLIQTNASINPGNSGGPLLNIDGEMIGINVAVRAGAQGIGFAIPVDIVMSVAANLMSVEREHLENTWHGVVPKSDPNGSVRQCVIGELDEESPAAKCGLKLGDVITAVGTSRVTRPLDFERAMLGHKPGEEIELSVQRNRQAVTVSLVLSTAPNKTRPPIADRAWDVIGLKLDTISPKQFRQTQSRYRGGLLVTAVKPGSPAARQGIQRGDILVGMHIWETISLENVAYILNRPDFSEIDPLLFYVVRDNETLYGHLKVSAQR